MLISVSIPYDRELVVSLLFFCKEFQEKVEGGGGVEVVAEVNEDNDVEK